MVRAFRSGSAILLVLIVSAMITIFVGSMASYFVTTARISNAYINERSVTRQEAMRSLEKVTQLAKDMVEEANGSAGSTNGVAGVVGNVENAITTLNTSINEYLGGKYYVVLSTRRLTAGDIHRLVVTATVYDWPEALRKKKQKPDLKPENILVILELIIDFAGTPPTEAVLPEIFNYVYFVDNYGHLETEAVIVNGDAHANNDFSIKWGVLNGKLTANGKITVANARAWPEKTYAKKIKAANENQSMTRVRPTNPITISSSSKVDWTNGYQPVSVANPYAGDYEKVGGKRPTAESVGISSTMPSFSGIPPDQAKYMPTTFGKNDVKTVQYQKKVLGRMKTVTGYCYEYTYNGTVYQSEYRDLASTCKAIDYLSTSTFMMQYKNHQSAGTAAYNAAVKQYEDDYEYYDTVTLKPWHDLEDAQKAWDLKAQEWSQKQADWSAKYDNGETEADLKSAKDATAKLFLQAKAEIIKMLNVSNTNEYKTLCKNQSGQLTCDNIYNGSRIWWKNRGQMDGVAMMYCKATKANFSGIVEEWSDWELDSADKNKLTKLIIEERDGSNPWRQKSTIPMRRELAPVKITGGYSNNVYPFSNYTKANSFSVELQFLETPGISQKLSKYGTRTYTVSYPKVPAAVKGIEKGSVILIGTSSNPITIKGPVYIDGDVVIRGVVTGRGTIYSGRNIHIIGDLVYKNPPKWPHDAAGLSGTSKSKVVSDNAGKDILLLSARGNIVIGDYTSSDWADSKNSQYLRSLHGGKSGYGDTYDDSAIGYGSSFSRDYTQNDGFRKVYLQELPENLQWSYLQSRTPILKTQWYYYLSNGPVGLGLSSYKDENWYHVPTLSAPSAANCKYYECVLGDAVIKGLKQLSNEEAAAEDNPVAAAPPFSNGQTEKNQNSGDITQIDAILFANHGIFGVVGGTSSHKFTLNGAMACRDEGLFPSFDSRFKGKSSPEPQIWLNWDMRFKSDADLANMVAIATGGGCYTNRVSSWRQVK